MAGINVGSVGVSVYPDTGQFWTRFRGETEPRADAEGRRLADRLTNAIPQRMARAVSEGLNANDAGHQGSDAGKSFSDEFTRQVFTRISTALRALPTDIRVDADTAPALAEIAGVRAALLGELNGLSAGGVDDSTLARVDSLRRELQFLQGDKLDIDTSGAITHLNALQSDLVEFRHDSNAAVVAMQALHGELDDIFTRDLHDNNPALLAMRDLHRELDDIYNSEGGFTVRLQEAAAAERVLLNDTDRLARAFDGAGFSGGGFLQVLLKLAVFLGPALIPMIAAGGAALLGMGVAAGGAALAIYGLYTNSNQAASDALIARWNRLKDVLTQMSAPAAGAFMDKFASGFDRVNAGLPLFTTMFSRFAADAGTIAGNVGLGLLSLLTALEPTANRIGLDFVRWSGSLTNIGNSQAFNSFLAYAAKEGPIVAEVLRDLGTIALRVVEAFQPWGNIVIAALGALANVLNAIPMPILQAMALIFEGFITYKLLGAVFDGIALGILKMGLAAESANMGTFATRLTSVAAGAERFAAVGGLITPVTAGVTAALLAGLFVWQKHEAAVQAAKAAIQQYTSALQQDNGVIGENTAKQAANQLQQAGAYDLAKKLGITQQELTQAALGNAQAQGAIKTAIDGATQAYADNLQQYGLGASAVDKDAKLRSDAAIALRKILTDQVGELGAAQSAQENLTAAVGQYATSSEAGDAATRALGAAQTYTTATVNGMVVSMQQGTSAADVYHNALQNLSGNSLDAAAAQLSFESSVQAASKALSDNSGNLDIHTAKGLADQQAIIQMIQAANQHADAVFKQTGSLDAANKALQDDEDRMYDAADAAGVNKDKVHDLIGQYAAVPGNVSTVFTANTDVAAAKVAALVQQMKDAKLTFDQLDVQAQTTGGARTDQFQGGSFAEGGYIVGPGTATSDSIPSWLSNGEFVVQASAVQAVGVGYLNQLNKAGGNTTPAYMKPRGYAAGGVVATGTGNAVDPVVAEIRALRAENAALLSQIAPQVGREVGVRIGAGGSRRAPGGVS